MNEQAVQDAFELFRSQGYTKSYEDFKQLMVSNSTARKDAYDLFVGAGYPNSQEDFDSLMGAGQVVPQPMMAKPSAPAAQPVKKKEETSLPLWLQQQQQEEKPQEEKLPPFLESTAAERSSEFLIPEIKPTPTAQPDKLTEYIDKFPTDIVDMDEGDAVTKLQYLYGDLGFQFNEATPGVDAVEVTAPDGSKKTFGWDSFTDSGDKQIAEDFKSFVKQKIKVDTNIDRVNKFYSGEINKIVNQKDADEKIKSLAIEQDDINNFIKRYNVESKVIQDRIAKLSTRPIEQQDALYQSEMKMLTSQYDALQKEKTNYESRIVNFDNNKAKLEQAVGSYVDNQGQIGSFSRAMGHGYLSGMGKVISGGVQVFEDLFVTPFLDAKSAVDAKERFADAATKLGLKETTEKEVLAKYGQEKVDEIYDKATDEFKKQIKYGMGTAELARRTPLDIYGTDNVTEEYIQKFTEGFWGGALYGLSSSLPAILSGGGTSAGRTLSFAAQSIDFVTEEMEKDPELKNLPENEKNLIKAPIAITVGVLEEFGLRNVVAQKGLLNGIVARALGKSAGVGTSRSFAEFVRQDVESMVARGLLTATAGAAAEFETGALQQLAEVGIKDIYNEVKGKEMFKKLPDTAVDYFKDIMYAGAQEAVGGFVLGVPGAIGNAYRKQGFEGLSDAEFQAFEEMANDSKIESAYVTKLKSQVNAGDISVAEGKEKLNDYRNARAIYNQVPSELSIEDKKKAMNLLRKRAQLEKSIEGKDAALIKPQQTQITDINNQLEELSKPKEDAIQEPSTEEGVLRPEEPQVGLQEVGEGDTQEQAPAEEVVTEEEVKTPEEQEAFNEEVKDLETLLGEDTTIEELPTLTQEEKQSVVDDINNLREKEKEQFKDNLQEQYTIGSEQTVEEKIDEKYDKQLDLFEQLSTPTPEAEVAPALVVNLEEAVQKAVAPVPVVSEPEAEVATLDEETIPSIDEEVNKINEEVNKINESIGRVEEKVNTRADEIALQDLGDKVAKAKKRIATADDTDAAIEEFKKAEKEKADFEESIEKKKNFRKVTSLIYDEIESSKDTRFPYEYQELFDQDPRLAALQSTKDMIEFAKENNRGEDMVKRLESDIKVLEEDIARFPVKEKVTPTPVVETAPVLEKPIETIKFEEQKPEVKQNETERRTTEQKEIDRRPNKRNQVLSGLLAKYSRGSRNKRGVNKRSVREVKRIGKFDVEVKAEYTLDSRINDGLKKIFPKFQGVQKIYEITDGAIFRKMMVASLKGNDFAASVTIHSVDDFNNMRMFVTEDGLSGLTINKEGFVGAGFSSSVKPNNLSQLIILAIKEGATTIEAFDTVLPEYYSKFGFKAVSRTEFNDEYRPLKKNKNTLLDWNYETYKDYNGGKPDVVFFIYDGGDRGTIEDRIGQFESYKTYEKQNTKAFSKDDYDAAEEVMKQEAVKRIEYENEKKEGVPKYTPAVKKEPTKAKPTKVAATPVVETVTEEQPEVIEPSGAKTIEELRAEYKQKKKKVQDNKSLSESKKNALLDRLNTEFNTLKTTFESEVKSRTVKPQPPKVNVEYFQQFDATSPIHESNMELLANTLKANKVKTAAEPMITIIKGKVLVEYNNFDNKGTATKFIFSQDQDGKWSPEGIKVERSAIPIRSTVFFENLVNPQMRTEEITTAQQVEDVPSNMVLTGNEEVVKGENMPTVAFKKDKKSDEQKYNDDYSFEDMMNTSHNRTSAVVTLAEKLSNGEMLVVEEDKETKQKYKVKVRLPYINKTASKKIAKLKKDIAEIKGDSEEAKKLKAKYNRQLNNIVKSVLNDFRIVMGQNILALYDSLTEDFVSRSKEWYVGANRMANNIAKAYDISLEQMSGIIAVLSPQNDWFNNVSLAERTVEVLSKHSDTIVSQDIFDKAMKINSSNKKSQFSPLLQAVYDKYGNISINDMQAIGATLDEQSIYLRAIDQALYSNKVVITSPSGKYLGIDTTPVRWASSAMISSAISIYRDGTSENINVNLGNGNKVRNFYNNIADPNSKTPYVTADTHALSVAMNLPVSAKVATDFGIFGGGNNPLYALVKTAYIDAANIAGVMPREMQSVTWEAQRTGVNDKNRTKEQKEKNFALVEKLRENEQTPYERATTIISQNRSQDPAWGKSDRVVTQRTSTGISSELESRANERASDVSSIRGQQRVLGGRDSAVDSAIANGRTNSTEEIATQKVGNDLPKIFQLVARLQQAFPSVVVSVDTETFNNIMNSEGVRAFVSDGVVIYGVTINGDIYINPEVHKSESDLFNTSIHEFGHVWQDFLSTTAEGQQLLERGYELIREAIKVDPYIQKLYNQQLNKLGDETKALNEVVAILIGNKGAEIVNKSISERIKDWLSDVWSYISSAFKMSSELTQEDIENMTLDDFIGTALADMLSGKQIVMTDAQLKQLNNPEAAFSTSQDIFDIVTTGRQNGFSDASIKAVLLKRGFKSKDIDAVMQVNLNLFDRVPATFGNVAGGLTVGMDLYNQTLNKLIEFQKAYGYKSMADIRQKAMELLQSNPIFKQQTDQIQKELTVAFDKVLNTKANKNVNAMIAAVKNDLKQRKIGENNLRDAQIALRTFIRNVLPKSKQYTQKDINRLTKLISETTVDNFIAQAEVVFDIVEKQQEKIKKTLLGQIYKLVVNKSKPAMTATGKRRSKGLDAQGQSFFEAAKQVLKAIYNNDAEALASIAEELSDTDAIDNVVLKSISGEQLTTLEQKLLDKVTAFDTFSGLMDMNIDQLSDLFQTLQGERKASIARLKESRTLRALRYQQIIAEADGVVADSHSILFTTEEAEDGTVTTRPKTENELNSDKDAIWESFNKLKIWDGVKKFAERWQYDSLPTIFGFFRNNIANIEFFTNLYDKTGKFFKKNIYDKLNQFNESYLQGYYKEVDNLDVLANSIDGITKGYKQIRKMLEIGVKEFTIKGRKQLLSGDQLLRIYALSKNDVQREKLRKMGFGDEQMQLINDLLPSEVREFADKIVQYFSTSYYESVNSVYSSLNDVNLQYVPNYFPTITQSQSLGAEQLLEGNFNGIFNAETAPALRERSDVSGEIVLSPDFTSVLESHLQTMEKYKAFAAGVKELNALFKSKGFNNLMSETGTKTLFKNLVNYTINPNAGPKIPSTLIDKLYTKYTGFALAFKAIQLPKQLTAFVFAYQNYQFLKDKKVFGLDAIMFMVDNAKVIATMPAQFNKARQISSTFRDRVAKGIEGDVFGLESGSKTFKDVSKRNTFLGRLVRGFKTVGAAPTVSGDLLSVMSYMAVYNRNIANGMSPEEALLEFNNFNATLQTRRGTEKSTLQTSQNAAIRAFTMFGSTAFLQLNGSAIAMQNISRDLKDGKTPDQGDIRRFIISFGVANFLFTFVANFAKLTRGDDEDEEKAKRAMMDALIGLNLIYQIPIIGAGVEGMVASARGERKPIEGMVNPIGSVSRKIKKGIESGDWVKEVQPFIEIGIGAQVDPLVALVSGAVDGFDENTMYDLMGISQSYRPEGKTKTEIESETKLNQEIQDISQFGMTRAELKKSNPDMYKIYFPEDVEVNGEKKERLSPPSGYVTPSESKSKSGGGYLTPSER